MHQPPILVAVERMITMEVIIDRACGMDVHKDSITACIITPKG
nr:IS110 family transposase [Psychrobacillus vulpis]